MVRLVGELSYTAAVHHQSPGAAAYPGKRPHGRREPPLEAAAAAPRPAAAVGLVGVGGGDGEAGDGGAAEGAGGRVEEEGLGVGLAVAADGQRARRAHLVPALLHLHAARLLEADVARLLLILALLLLVAALDVDVAAEQDPLLPLPVGLHQRRLQKCLGVRLQLADELERGRPHYGLRRRRVQQRRARPVPPPHRHRVRDPPRRVPLEPVRPPGQQLPDALHAAGACRQVQSRAPGESVDGGWRRHDGALVEQQAHAGRAGVPRSQVQRRGAPRVPHVDEAREAPGGGHGALRLRRGAEDGLQALGVAVVGGVVEARPGARRVEGQDVGAAAEEPDHALGVATHGRHHQRRLLLAAQDVHVAVAIQQHGQYLEAAVGGGDVKSGEAVVDCGAAGERGVGGEEGGEGVDVAQLRRAEQVVLVGVAAAAQAVPHR
mgnify:CR=1 FL=1